MKECWKVCLVSGLILVGEVCLNISLPLVLDSLVLKDPCGDPNTDFNGTYCLILIDVLFQFFISGIIFTIFGESRISIFGKAFLLYSLMDIIYGLCTPYVSNTSRNSATIQAILLNCYVILNVLIRFLWLKRVPSLKQGVCVVLVILGLAICVINNLQENGGNEMNYNNGLKTKVENNMDIYLYRLICGMHATNAKLPDTMCNICLEKIFMGEDPMILSKVYAKLFPSQAHFEHQTVPDAYCLFFVSSILKFISVATFFWIDLIPEFGFSRNLKGFSNK
ncbi:hypothetical protein RF11_02008 [Thelohanellus kitauei]|uniref:Uncharacterized protein n=1 Tax=Thelohanellus kitauei TaxID=669202 RepID=A0A0C2N2A4_THEKT|nr:hypothetical protein RF11_02008 [Thelohanellus kitauei]